MKNNLLSNKINLGILFCLLSIHQSILAIPLLEDLVVPIAQANSKECETFTGNLSTNYDQGYVEVPINYSNPIGPKINVFYYTNLKSGQTPVVFFNDHPTDANRQLKRFELIAKRFDLGFIFVDQRGTGCSGAIPKVTNNSTAKEARLYGVDSIAKDHDVVRRHLLGENGRWVVFSSNFGGAAALEEYIVQFPKFVISAHEYDAIRFDKTSDLFAEFIYSTHKSLEQIYKIFPNVQKKLSALSEKFTEDKCLKILNDKLCGKALLVLYMRNNLGRPTQWGYLESDIDEAFDCRKLPCMFFKNELNQDYLDLLLIDNPFMLNLWWGAKGTLTFSSFWRINSQFEKEDIPSMVDVCLASEAKLRTQFGIEPSQVLINECDLLKRIFSKDDNETLAKVFKDVSTASPKNSVRLKTTLEKNPSLKLHLYSADFGIAFSNATIDRSVLPSDQYIVHTFNSADYNWYDSLPVIWQNISGLTERKLIGEKLNLTYNGQIKHVEKVGRINGSLDMSQQSGPIQNELVYVGTANEPLDEETAARVAGKFALIKRGGSAFTNKVANVVAAGAAGFIIANHLEFPDVAFSVELGQEEVKIPGLMISTSLGGELIQRLNNNETVHATFGFEN
jgi:ribosomal protein L10